MEPTIDPATGAAPREEWRPVPGRPDYDVSNMGRIRSRRCSRTKILSGASVDGYRVVNLQGRGPGRRKMFKVARLVLSAFVGPSSLCAAHENGKRADNRLVNLSWKTHAANNRDKVRHGTVLRGESHPHAKVAKTDVREIRRLAATGMSTRAIAQRYPLSQSSVGRIVRGATWRHTWAEDRLALALAEVPR